MLRYKDFIDAVRERLGGVGMTEARQAVARTVGGLVLWLPREERPALRDALPAPLRPADIEDAAVVGGDAPAFVRFVAGREGRPPELVRYEVQAVLLAVVSEQPDGSYRIEVWTHSEDRVTDLDVPFVLAVEDLIDDVLAERQPTRTPPPEREIDPRRPPAGPVPGTSDRRWRKEDH